jgi:hypothetical protein
MSQQKTSAAIHEAAHAVAYVLVSKMMGWKPEEVITRIFMHEGSGAVTGKEILA